MIPDSIKIHRPVGTEIRLINNTYYVYKISSVYDKEKKRAKKVTGKCIGKITESDGFVPSKQKNSIDSVSIKQYGVEKLFENVAINVFEDLKNSFPDIYREIYTIALLRLVDKVNFSEVKKYYDNSSLSDRFSSLALSKNSMTNLLKLIGKRDADIYSFLKYKNISTEDDILLFDGTTMFSNSSNSSYSRKGFNHGKKRTKQLNLLYAFSYTNSKPMFYKLLPGNITDKQAFVKTIQEFEASKAVVIGDKGFYSKKNRDFLDENNISYILPLVKSLKIIEKERNDGNDISTFTKAFIYNNRTIYCKKRKLGKENHYIYTFFDSERKQIKENEFVKKIEAGNEGYTQKALKEEQKRFGIFSFISNLNKTPDEIYLLYKGRWEIEVYFDYLKNTLDLGTVYLQDDDSIKAWAFLNHITTLIYYSLLNKLMTTEDSITKTKNKKKPKLISSYSPEDIIKIAKAINKVTINNSQSFVSPITNKDASLLESIGVHIT